MRRESILCLQAHSCAVQLGTYIALCSFVLLCWRPQCLCVLRSHANALIHSGCFSNPFLAFVFLGYAYWKFVRHLCAHHHALRAHGFRGIMPGTGFCSCSHAHEV